MSTIITEPKQARESFPCPPWCTSAGEPDHVEPTTEVGHFRSHCTDEIGLHVENVYGDQTIRGEVALWVVADETLTAASTTAITHPLVRLIVGNDEALLTVDQLLTLSDMCAQAAVTLGKIERGESL